MEGEKGLLCGRRGELILGGWKEGVLLWKEGRVHPGWKKVRCSFVKGRKKRSLVEGRRVLLCGRRQVLILGGGREDAPLGKKEGVDPGWRAFFHGRREELILGVGREDAPL